MSGFDLFSMFCFSKIPIMTSLDSLSSGPPKRNYIKCYIKQYILRVTERTLIFKKQLSVAASVSICILDQAHLNSLTLLL